MNETKNPTLVDETNTSVHSSPDERSSPTELIYVDPEKEKAALRKFDKWLVPVAFVFLVLSSLDRNNIGNAKTFGFEKDIGLYGHRFGNITTLLSVTLVLFEVPWVMAVKKFGPNKALGTALVLWSMVTLGTAFIQNYAQAIVVRMLLGACEAGVSPGFAYLFSTIYPRRAAGKRIMMTNLANCTSGAFGGLFAYAVQLMGKRRGLEPWRWLFIVEFCLTMVVGGACWFILPDTPETAWFLSEEEKETMVLRKRRDEQYRGNNDSLRKWLKPSFTDPFVYLLGIAFFTSSVAITGFGIFLPTILQGLGYHSLQVQYMTIPVYVLGATCLVTNCYFSDKFARRGPFLVACAFPVMTGYLICVGTSNPHAGYAGMFILVMGVYTISTLAVAWIGTNVSPDAKRAVAMPFAYSIANLSALVSAQLYPSDQGPRYIQGNSISAGLDIVAAGLYFSCWMLLRRRNLKKDKAIAEGATTNGYEDDRGLDFKYML
ncbi:MFS general substrate transporter [Aaosphaeria arxii CBS 175.79]|uniref:MFS general substrate transporter n=1 Tax=Aaosphaeria arxii CBS 175.79 TaxID=1450172 RepID=A0A6A5XR03_9PLEO|nr:MFS general substrate transporter [Aaosphaeria arxii CBS 175.79]KAF2015363.1 MFS general substrate transporter [Aaosphaeria arxii CBS 175.79]